MASICFNWGALLFHTRHYLKFPKCCITFALSGCAVRFSDKWHIAPICDRQKEKQWLWCLAASIVIEHASSPVINITSTNYYPHEIHSHPRTAGGEGGYTVQCQELLSEPSVRGRRKRWLWRTLKEAIGLVLEVLSQDLMHLQCWNP